jgi:hypothetical protein
MINAPTIVRLVRFPKTYALAKKGKQFVGPLRRSGPVILSERHDPIECTFRLTEPGLSFTTGGTTVMGTEAFNEGEMRDFLLPWALVSDGKARPRQIILEIDVNYEGSAEKHTATVPLALTYTMRRRAVGTAVAVAAAAVAVAAASRGRKKNVVIDDEGDVEVSLFNVAPTSRTRTTSRPTNVKGAKVRVVDEEDVDLAVFNVPTRRPSSKKKESQLSRKRSAAKARPASKNASSKKASSRKASSKKAPAKKAGGTPRGSAASRSAPRKGARGSSAARKSSARGSTRQATRKSR